LKDTAYRGMLTSKYHGMKTPFSQIILQIQFPGCKNALEYTLRRASLWNTLESLQPELAERPPVPPAGGGVHACSGASCYIWKIFLVF